MAQKRDTTKIITDKLAIKGGMPVRKDRIYYGGQWIEDDDVKAVNKVLVSEFITCGPKVEELEKALVDYTGAGYAVAVSNGRQPSTVRAWQQVSGQEMK